MSEDSLKLEEVVELIKICSAKRVSMIKFRGVTLVFDRKTMSESKTLTARQTKAAEKSAQTAEQEEIQRESRKLDDLEVGLMQIEDPARFEQELIEGTLVDESESAEKA